jgi:chitinase
MKTNQTKKVFRLMLLACLAWMSFLPHSTMAQSKVIVGYFHNWNNASAPYIRLRDVNAKYNVVNIAFATPVSHGDMTMTFEPTMQTKAEFISDIKALQAQGRRVQISIGGADAPVEIHTAADRTKFVNSMKNIITEYGFDGYDIDLEGTSVILNPGDSDFKNPTTPKIGNLISASREIVNHFRGQGNDFWLTAAPETQYVQGGFGNYGTAFGGYLPVLYALRDLLTFVHVQYYNTGSQIGLDDKIYSQGTPDFIVSMTDMLLRGFPVARNNANVFPALREDQVAFGLPATGTGSAPAGGYVTPANINKALDYLMKGISFGGTYVANKTYPGLRGIMTWSANWDKTQGDAFVNNAHSYFGGIVIGPTPAAPGNLSASATSTSQINLTWSDNSNNETLFRIERSTDGGNNWSSLTTVSANATTYSNTGLSASTTYHYRVRAENANGNSGYSNTANATTQGTGTVPNAPGSLSASATSSSQINLSWSDNSNNETLFRIERSPNGSSSWTSISTVGSNVTTFSNTGLSASTTYHYRVRAENSTGNSGYSNTASATTQTTGTSVNLALNKSVTVSSTETADFTGPKAVDGSTSTRWASSYSDAQFLTVDLGASSTITKIVLNWEAAYGRSYRIETSNDGTSFSTLVTQTNSDGGIDEYTVSTSARYVRMQGVTRATQWGYSLWEFEVWGSQGTVTTPAAPSNLSASAASTSQINLTWTDNASNETTFRIERSPNGSSNWESIATVNANITAYSNTGLAASTTYHYRVRAENASGNSGYSNSASATTQTTGTVPAAPGNLSASATSATQINLSWSDNSSNETTFRIERSPNGSSNWASIATVNANITTYSNTGLTAATTYHYRVRAENSIGNSSYSNTANATTQSTSTVPAAPSNLSASASSSSQINLSWNDNSNNEASFNIERAPGGSSSWTSIASVSANVTTYANTGLSASTTYQYRVRATNTTGNSDYSNTVSATTEGTGGGGCDGVSQYVDNGGYVAGSIVKNVGNKYECKPWPFTGWCNAGGSYAPGIGFAWKDAWTLVGACGTDNNNNAPSVSITAPSNGQVFSTAGQVITISANASDTDGNVTKVEFFVDGSSVGVDTSSPYQASWTSTNGFHTIVAKATDNSSNTKEASITTTVGTTNNGNLPARIMVGYWHTWNGGVPFIKLRDVNSNWDVINISFAEPTNKPANAPSTDGRMKLDITGLSSGYTINDFKADVKLLQSKGKKIVLSIGGWEGTFSLPNAGAATQFVNDIKNIVNEYGFDGIDIDTEQESVYFQGGENNDPDFKNPVSPTIVNLISGIRQVVNSYGPNFILSWAPETYYFQMGKQWYGGAKGTGANHRAGVYIPMIHALRDKTTYVQAQLYNSMPIQGLDGTLYDMGTTPGIVAMCKMVIDGFNVNNNPSSFFPGLRPDQVVIGVPSSQGAAGSGQISNSGLQQAFTQLKNSYPALRGIMAWSINWDAFQNNNSFVTSNRQYLNGLGAAREGEVLAQSFVPETEDDGLITYPNPIAPGGTVHIELDTRYPEAIVSITGVGAGKSNPKVYRNVSSIDVQVPEISSGLHIITVIAGKKTWTRKIMNTK